MSGDRLMLLPDGSDALLDAVRAVLATPGMPDVALVGGLAVTLHVAAAGNAHRATADIDLVTASATSPPEAVELLATAHDSPSHPLVIAGVKVDLIPTHPFANTRRDPLTDAEVLFAISHRWAFDTAVPTQLTTRDSDAVTIPVATPAGVLAAKCHAIGYPTSMRRATKHSADLLDMFRIVDLYDRDGSLAVEIAGGPPDLAGLIATVADAEILANPALAAHAMALASLAPIAADAVVDAIEPFVAGLRS
ncbi:MAG: nucleotidyl transferase AbiEii/AbiGii toxin family protein [Acidimicrobiia bacterium]|nr:nucleotidyl transferase AbiEii/AbiGii toxin family protein [Acidimicrobiia bacterium]